MIREIERLYPPERIARSKARLKAVWELKRPPDRIPFVFGWLPPETEEPELGVWEGTCTNEESLGVQLESIIDRAALDDDYVPALFPGCRQGTIPTAYGAEEERNGKHMWVKPMLRDAKDVYELGRPDFTREGVAAEFLERVRFFRAATQGRMPIQLADMQGPLDLASNMWGSEPLLEAMYTDPDAVHHLLQMMTDAFIDFARLLQEAAEGDLIPIHCLPIVWMPPERGMALSEDLVVLVSPKLYKVFGRPYNEQIADTFGGVVIHSCGSTEHNLEILAGTRHLMGVNLSVTETALPAIVDALGKNAVALTHFGEVTCNDLPALTPEEHLRLCMTTFKEKDVRGIVFVMPLETTREEVLALNPLALDWARLE
jgi:hypothetical protein